LYAGKKITAYLLLKMNGPDLRVANLRRNVGLCIQNLNGIFFFFKKKIKKMVLLLLNQKIGFAAASLSCSLHGDPFQWRSHLYASRGHGPYNS